MSNYFFVLLIRACFPHFYDGGFKTFSENLYGITSLFTKYLGLLTRSLKAGSLIRLIINRLSPLAETL